MATPDWKHLGEMIVAERERQRLTQNEMQGKGGPSSTLIRQIEKGANTNISSRTKTSIEDALGWERGVVDELLAGATIVRRKDHSPETVTAEGESAGVGTIKARKPANMTDEDFKRLLAEYEEEIEWKLDRAARER